MVTYLTTDDVQSFNAQFIGPNGLIDFGRLDAAVVRP